MTFFDLISFLFLRNYLFQQKSFSSMPFNTRCFIRCNYRPGWNIHSKSIKLFIFVAMYTKRFSKRFIAAIPFQFRFLYRCQFLPHANVQHMFSNFKTRFLLCAVYFFDTFTRETNINFFFFCKICFLEMLKKQSITIFF